MYKTLSMAESKLRKLEKRNMELRDDVPIKYSIVDDDGTVIFEKLIPPRREWKYQ